MVTGAGAFPPLVGLLLDLACTGATAQGAHVYEAYRLALTSLIACGVGVLWALAVRETFCLPHGP